MGMTESRENDEEKFVAFVQGALGDMRAPDAGVPREEMWAAITRARAEARRAAQARRRTMWVGIGMAATLVVGVAIGRYVPRESALPPVAAAPAAPRATGAYDVASAQHMTRAEALLVSYAHPVDGSAGDSLFTGWARDLLSNTRLLLDSPAANDAARRRLLEDLERVLVQMVQKSPAESDADVRAHVERTVDRTQILTRLRSSQRTSLNSGS
jgi:hypothetical protein